MQVRPPMPPVFFFLIDVSMTAVSSGAVAAACSAVNHALADLGVRPLSCLQISTGLDFSKFLLSFSGSWLNAPGANYYTVLLG
jgi:hypothetical protein